MLGTLKNQVLGIKFNQICLKYDLKLVVPQYPTSLTQIIPPTHDKGVL